MQHWYLHLPQVAPKTGAGKRTQRKTSSRIRVVPSAIESALVLAAAIVWPFLYWPSWRWDLVASVLYLAASGILLSAFLRGAHTDEFPDD